MASKVLVPAAPPPFIKLQVKTSSLEPAGSGFIISGDPAARVAHLEHSVRFLQEQHRLMLHDLHAEIETLRERNRDLQFQLIFNKESKESSPKPTSPPNEEVVENNEEVTLLKSEVSRLEKEAAATKIEAQIVEVHVTQLQELVDIQAEKIRELKIIPKCVTCEENKAAGEVAAGGEDDTESRAELRARLADAEHTVRRLKIEADRRRKELMACAASAAASSGGSGAVTNLVFESAAARQAHLHQLMKRSLHAGLRAARRDAYGFQNSYHFPPVHHTPEFWREPNRESITLSTSGTDFRVGDFRFWFFITDVRDFHTCRGRGSRRPPPVVVLPELSGRQVPFPIIYCNKHAALARAHHDTKNNKPQPPSSEVTNGKSPEQEPSESRLSTNCPNFLPKINKCNVDPNATFPELKIVVTKMIPHGNVSNSRTTTAQEGSGAGAGGAGAGAGAGAGGEAGRVRQRRPHRKHAAEHT